MQAFKAAFDPQIHVLSVSMLFLIPEDVFFTKKGEISMRSGDVDNYIKLTSDFLFNDKYFDDPCRLESGDCFNLGVDDRFISDITAIKRPSHDWAIQISAEIKSIDIVNTDLEVATVESKWIIKL